MGINMKVKGIMITVLVCVLLISAGTLGFSSLYQTLFHAENISQEYTANSTKWQEAQLQFEKEILYTLPFLIETEIVTEIDESSIFSNYYINYEDVFSLIMELADVDWEDMEDAVITTYEFKIGTTEYEEYLLKYLFHIVLMQNDGNNDMIVAVNGEGVIVLFQYGVSGKFEDMDNNTVITSSFVAQDDLPANLSDYLAGIDIIMLDGSGFYWWFLSDIAGEIFSRDEEIRIGGLLDYCQYGEWRVYSDSVTEAYVCIIGVYNFILYYDVASEKFCGYSIALNTF
jgi:hypothetical protein